SLAVLPQQVIKPARRVIRDPILAITLVVIVLFVGVSIILPIFAMVRESLSEQGLSLFSRYLSETSYQTIISNTVILGLAVATLGTLIGFLFAYVQVKVRVPFKRFMHILALVPIISPPFALASALIILFGRNGMILRGIFGTRCLWGSGRTCNDIYGLDGLT